jgi:hypothetical protein
MPSMADPIRDAIEQMQHACMSPSLQLKYHTCLARHLCKQVARACLFQSGTFMIAQNVGGRMGEFRLLYLLCMLRFPVPLHSLQASSQQLLMQALCTRQRQQVIWHTRCVMH